MNLKEAWHQPTGRFPSAAEESLLRFGFIDRANPILADIRARLHELGYKRLRNLPMNLLAFYYGVYFYNQISHQALFGKGDPFPIKIVADPEHPAAAYAGDGQITINIASRQAKETLHLPPLAEADIFEYHDVSICSYVAQILDGIEEASHLHLERLHTTQGANVNSRSNHRHFFRLWKISELDPVQYRAKLWHEFAAFIVQVAYLNYYMTDEYPDTVSDYNTLYAEATKVRRAWLKRKGQLR